MPKINSNPRWEYAKWLRQFCLKRLMAIHGHLHVIRWRRRMLRNLKQRQKC